MVYIIKDLKKKQINQRFIDEVGERTNAIRRSYDEVKRESKKLKEMQETFLKKEGLGIKSFELRRPGDVEHLQKLMSILGEHGGMDNTTIKQELAKRGADKLYAIDEHGNIKGV